MKILIATKNPGKFLEIREMLSELDAVFYSLKDLEIEDDFEENASSFEENALGKARFYAELSGMVTVADDSGILIEALADELGVKTRRWGAGQEASDEEWLEYFMKRMKAEGNRRAKFVCASAIVTPDDEQVFLGNVEGEILRELAAAVKPGIPLSSVFKADGCDKVYAAMDEHEKNTFSHRGYAFKSLFNYLQLR